MFCDWYLSTKLLSFDKSEHKKRTFGAVKISNSYFLQLHLSNSSPKNTFTFFDYIFHCSNFILMRKKCFLGSLRINKSSSICENFLNWSLIAPKKKYQKYRTISKKSRYENIRLYRTKNTGLLGFCKNTVP